MIDVFIFAKLSYIIGMLFFWVAFASMGARKTTIKETKQIFLNTVVGIVFLTMAVILNKYSGG